MARKRKITKDTQHGDIKNTRHKIFADEFVMNGGVLWKAYQKAYPECVDKVRASQSGWKLANQNEKIKDYIEKIRNVMTVNYEINRDNIISEILDQIEACKIESDRANLIKLLDMLNKMAGNYTAKSEVTHKGLTLNYIQPLDIDYTEQNLLED